MLASLKALSGKPDALSFALLHLDRTLASGLLQNISYLYWSSPLRSSWTNRLCWLSAALIFSTCGLATADEWPGPQTREVFSKNREHFVRVIPGESWGDANGFAGSPKGEYAKAMFYHLRGDGSYGLGATVRLLNPVAPVEFFVTDQGYLVTLDNWHNVGYGKILVLYGSDGAPIKSYELKDLFSGEEINRFDHSVSSIWWHKGPAYVDIDQKAIFISLDDKGTDLILDATFGTYRSCKWQNPVQVKDFVCRTSNLGRQWLPF